MLNGLSINGILIKGQKVVGILQVASLASLAFVSSSFALLSENAEFFIAHKIHSEIESKYR